MKAMTSMGMRKSHGCDEDVMLALEQVKVLWSGRTPAVAAGRAVLAANALGQIAFVDAQSPCHFCGRTPKPQWCSALLFTIHPQPPKSK